VKKTHSGFIALALLVIGLLNAPVAAADNSAFRQSYQQGYDTMLDHGSAFLVRDLTWAGRVLGFCSSEFTKQNPSDRGGFVSGCWNAAKLLSAQ
jgi:hypothetical protein